ncbi:hypothetical protein LINGRAHAP2_LOCUS8358 [Linum grandiflorum]
MKPTHSTHLLLFLMGLLAIFGNHGIRVDAKLPGKFCLKSSVPFRVDCTMGSCFEACVSHFGVRSAWQCDSAVLWVCNCYLPCT